MRWQSVAFKRKLNILLVVHDVIPMQRQTTCNRVMLANCHLLKNDVIPMQRQTTCNRISNKKDDKLSLVYILKYDILKKKSSYVTRKPSWDVKSRSNQEYNRGKDH